MIAITTLLSIVALLIKCSAENSADKQNETPSKVTVNEYFNNPILPPPVSPFGPPTLGSNFVHQGTNFFFNPQIHLGTHVSPPSETVIAAVKTNVSEILPCIKETQVSVLPEISVTPVLPPKPVEVIIEEPFAMPIPPPPFVPVDFPVLSDPVLIKVIPDAPVLPPLELPKFPVLIEETVEVKPPSPSEVIISEVMPVPIPEGPILPPLILPEIPPVFTAESENDPCSPIKTPIIELLPIPQLEPLHGKVSEDIIYENSVYTVPAEIMRFNDIEIPSAPELPPFVMPDIPKPIPVGEFKKVVLIPPTPEIATIVAPKPPVEAFEMPRFVETENESLFPIPTVCARNIVLERVLPNIVVNKKTITKSVEIISIPAAANYPVLTTPFIPNLVRKN